MLSTRKEHTLSTVSGSVVCGGGAGAAASGSGFVGAGAGAGAGGGDPPTLSVLCARERPPEWTRRRLDLCKSRC